MTEYYKKIKFVQSEVERYLHEIFKVYGNELLLRLEDYNLLTHSNNCLEASTATGFIMEEFIVSKLEIYTENHTGIDNIKIKRVLDHSTNASSYDCYVIHNDIFVMVNIKIQKYGSSNNAVASINALHSDYVLTNPTQEKAYLVFKTFYDFGHSEKDLQRKILIKDLGSYFLEELDFSSGHKQDHRNWSINFNANSGRLQVPDTWRKKHILYENEISYYKTKDFIESIYNANF